MLIVVNMISMPIEQGFIISCFYCLFQFLNFYYLIQWVIFSFHYLNQCFGDESITCTGIHTHLWDSCFFLQPDVGISLIPAHERVVYRNSVTFCWSGRATGYIPETLHQRARVFIVYFLAARMVSQIYVGLQIVFFYVTSYLLDWFAVRNQEPRTQHFFEFL
jgi:hypothetical protein